MSDEQLLSVVGEIVQHSDLRGYEEDLLRLVDRQVQHGQILVETKTPLKRLEEQYEDSAESSFSPPNQDFRIGSGRHFIILMLIIRCAGIRRCLRW